LLSYLVDLIGIEPMTSSMPWKRAPSCATGPHAAGMQLSYCLRWAGFRQTWAVGGFTREGNSKIKNLAEWEHFGGVAVSKSIERAGTLSFSSVSYPAHQRELPWFGA
jgi:hypothetical protein